MNKEEEKSFFLVSFCVFILFEYIRSDENKRLIKMPITEIETRNPVAMRAYETQAVVMLSDISLGKYEAWTCLQ